MNATAARIGALWFGIQAVWSALLGIVVQSRVVAVRPTDDVRSYAVLAAVGAAIAAIVQVVVGIASDRRRANVGHRREFLMVGLLIALPAILATVVAPTFPLLVLAFLALQIGMNVLSGPYQAVVPDTVAPDANGRASAWMGALSFAGSVTGLVLAATLPAFAVGAALMGILAASFAVTYRHLRGFEAEGAHTEPLTIDGPMWTVLISRGAINVGFYTLFGFLFFFVRESLGVADARGTTGVLFIAFTIAGVVGAAVAGRPADRFDKRAVVSVAAGVIATAIICFAGAPTVTVALVAASVAGCAWGAFFTADWAIAFSVLPRGSMAAAMGVWNLAAAIPQVIAPVVTEPVVRHFSALSPGRGPRVALLMVALEFVVGAAWLWRLPRK